MHWTVHLEGGPQRVNHAAASVGDLIYTFGGYSTRENQMYRQREPIDVHVLNTITLTWRWLSKPRRMSTQYDVTPYQRYGHTVLAYGKNIYLWGGRNDEATCNVLYCFDTETWLWSCPVTTGAIPCCRDGHSACIIGDKMYIFGGVDEGLYSQDIYALDLKKMEWSYIITQGNFPEYRDFHTATAIGNRMYIFGGRSERTTEESGDDDYYPNTMMYLDVGSMQWYTPKTFGQTPIGRRSHSAFLYEGDIYIFGGYNGVLAQHFNDLHKFCPRTNTWSVVPTLGTPPIERRRQVCIVINNQMYLFGGTSPNPNIPNNFEDDRDHVDIKLVDHGDLHILDLKPSLKTLSMLAVATYNISDGCLPEELKFELNTKAPSSRRPTISGV